MLYFINYFALWMYFSVILDQCSPLASKGLAIVESIEIARNFGLEGVYLF